MEVCMYCLIEIISDLLIAGNTFQLSTIYVLWPVKNWESRKDLNCSGFEAPNWEAGSTLPLAGTIL